MNNFKNIVLATAALCAGFGAIIPGNVMAATSGNSEYVENVDINFNISIVYLDVKNASNSKYLNQVNLQPQTTNLEIPAVGYAKCARDKKVDFHSAKAYFGGVGMGGLDNINESGTLYSAPFEITSADWGGNLNGWFTESNIDEEPFIVPVNQIKNGHPALRIDPIEIMNQKLQAHIQGGGTKLSFYQHDQEVSVSRPISVAAWCSKNGLKKAGFETKNYNIIVRYKGDPEITDKIQLNAKLGQGPQQVTNDLPFQITQATFQPNLPTYVGKCAPDDDPVIRVNFKGTGAGSMLLKIDDGGNTVPTTPITLYDSKDQYERHVDLAYPLTLRLAQNESWGTLNKTFNHPLKIMVRVKNKGSDIWGSWKQFDTTNWKHRCTPQVNVNVGGVNGGSYAKQGEPAKPAAIGTFKAVPQAPKPPARAAD